MTEAELMELTKLLVIAAGLLAVLAGAAWLADRKKDAPVDHSPRSGQRVPTAERQLLGDDWREPIRPYFRRRWECHLRTRLAIAATCGADPDLPENENGDRAATTAGLQDTRNGDSPCHEAA